MAGVGFTRDGARRVAGAVRHVEQMQTGGPAVGTGGIVLGGLRLARSPSGGIAAISGSTLGSGTVTFYGRSGSTLTLGSTTATAYNAFATAVPELTKVWVSPDNYIVGWECT